jgi:hypothetical protein
MGTPDQGDDSPVPDVAGEGTAGVPEDPEDSGQKAINYGAEPLWYRLGISPNTPLGGGHGGPGSALNDYPTDNLFSNAVTGGSDPQTPVFKASASGPDEVRFRLLVPGGHARNSVFVIHGHAWPRYPYINNSTVIGYNPLSWWIGGQEGVGPSSHFDILIPRAGGPNRVPGDYLFRDEASFGTLQGLWGLLRVTP